VEEAIKAMEYPNLQSIQIIYNLFRQRPGENVLDLAKSKGVGILARVPLSSGMLTGKMTAASTFEDSDHRQFNREGAAFDKGETFSGVPYSVGLEAVEIIRSLVPGSMSMTQFALKWILTHQGVTCAIPGAKTPSQSQENFSVSELPEIGSDVLIRLQNLYADQIAPYVHQRW